MKNLSKHSDEYVTILQESHAIYKCLKKERKKIIGISV